ncbi:hypothetical protein O3P69_009000 [Scylla paramamosain]|uniref:Uncharacterized protein n=1 Tax=Scylla paramamosain TaxID=85552 RepID=A0AAW0TPL0_SCYPA
MTLGETKRQRTRHNMNRRDSEQYMGHYREQVRQRWSESDSGSRAGKTKGAPDTGGIRAACTHLRQCVGRDQAAVLHWILNPNVPSKITPTCPLPDPPREPDPAPHKPERMSKNFPAQGEDTRMGGKRQG